MQGHHSDAAKNMPDHSCDAAGPKLLFMNDKAATHKLLETDDT